jgi:hypothetical protein
MKIKIWALVLVIVGALAFGGIGGFVAAGGVGLTGKLLQTALSARTSTSQSVQANTGSESSTQSAGKLNAGVSVASVYAEMTNRTETQIETAAQAAQTDVWGLAYKEGKLDDLKTKVLAAVTESLEKMVSSGQVTKTQAQSYLMYVTNMLQSLGQSTTGTMPGDGSGTQGGSQSNWQDSPDTSSSSTSKS